MTLPTSPALVRSQPRATHLRIALAIASAVLSTFLFLALEIVVVGTVLHQSLTGPWELRVALSRLLPVSLSCALPVALLSAALDHWLVSHERSARYGITGASVAAALALGWGITFGRHFQRLELRLSLIAIFALSIGAALWFFLPRIARWRCSAPNSTALACALLAPAIELVNIFVLPRLYPAFHVALSLLALAFAAWAGRPLAVALPPRASLAVAAALTLVAIAISPWAARDLHHRDNVRFLYASNAPTLAHALRVAAWTHSPTHDAAAAPEVATHDERWLHWENRDLLIVSIDAVRADHVGTYGYGRPTTPNIDALAARGVVFERAYTVMPHTSYAMTSLLTGKYIRPLLLQGTGHDSDTLAAVLRTYGYRTAAFFPPSLWAVDEEHFAWAKPRDLDFEYRKIEYADAKLRTRQALEYLERAEPGQRLFVWTHFFEPHEPYAPPPGFDFGTRDIDRYDAEIAAADAAVGTVAKAFLERSPDAVVIVTADHGEAFGDHGTYYHGTTVYEEQVRVPLVIVAKGLEPRRVAVPVQLIDLFPTVLRAMDVPRRPRVRGNDLGGWMVGKHDGEGFAFAETHDQVLLAESSWRLLCERKIDACRLFDVSEDPGQIKDVAARHPERFMKMRQRLRGLEESHGTYERAGSRAEGKDLPAPLVRGMAGDVDAAMDVAALLDDADVVLRRKAAEVLFDLARKETAPALTLAMSRDEDEDVRRWCAVTLTRLGHGAPLAIELLDHHDVHWQRRAALALAESGDGRGEAVLLSWWGEPDVGVETRKSLARAFATIRSGPSVVPLTRHLENEQLRPTLADALAKIGEPYAKIPLLRLFAEERYVHTRVVLARALVKLGATREMAPALRRFLGVPDPLPDGLRIALDGEFLDAVGGPDAKSIARLREAGIGGKDFRIAVPKGGNGQGLRVLVLAKAAGPGPGQVRFGPAVAGPTPHLDSSRTILLDIAVGDERQVFADVPATWAREGRVAHVVVDAGRGTEVLAFALVPRADEIPPPPPRPWRSEDAGTPDASP